jgi:hypothetical protein
MEHKLETPVLFAKIGWMNFYNGPRAGDLKPLGGGRNNRTNFGHEGFNFRQHGNRLLGFVKTPAQGGRLALQKIDPSAVTGSRIRGATVVFVATDPKFAGQRIVGWYQNATIYAERVAYEPAVKSQMIKEVRPQFRRFEPSGYSFDCNVSNAVLLPLSRRRDPRGFTVPKKNGLGQANVCYPFDNDGGAKEWVLEAVGYVGSYSGPNLLLGDEGVQDELEDAANEVREKGAGFLSNLEIRDKIEEYAMECAKKYLVRRGYRSITRTDKGHCYDYTCTGNGRTVYVEVKGTQTRGEKIILTKNEKAHLESNADTILYVRHSIDVTSGKTPRVSGGREKVLDRWDPKSGSFSAVTYFYTLPIAE